MKPTKIPALIAVVALAVPLASAADTRHKLGFFVGGSMPTGDDSHTDEIEGYVYHYTDEADSTAGLGFGYEFRYNEWTSFAASLSCWQHDVNTRVVIDDATAFDGKYAEISWMPVLFDANFHLLRDKTADFYLGPTLGYAMFDDFDSILGEDAALEDQVVYGVNFGLDVPFPASWAFSFNLRYLLLAAETKDVDSNELDIDPLILTVGISRKF